MKKLLILLALPFILFSCDDYGEKVTVKGLEVFYKGEDVTENDAKKLGKFLTKNKLINTPSSIQLTKADEDYVIKVVVDDEKMDEKNKLSLWNLQYLISEKVFDGTKTSITLTDEKFKEVEQLPALAKHKVKGEAFILYNSDEFKKSDVKKLGEYLLQIGFFSGESTQEAIVTKEDDANIVRLVVNKETAEKNFETFMEYYQHVQYTMKSDIFKNKKTRLVLTTINFEDLKKIPQINAEKNTAYLQKLNNQNPSEEFVNNPITDTTTSGVLRYEDQ